MEKSFKTKNLGYCTIAHILFKHTKKERSITGKKRSFYILNNLHIKIFAVQQFSQFDITSFFIIIVDVAC